MFAAIFLASSAVLAQDEGRELPREVQSLLTKYCLECHSTDVDEGNFNLEAWTEIAPALRNKRLEQIDRVLRSDEMPPTGSPQPSAMEREAITRWSTETLERIARRTANDPGPIVLRRLSNSEYTYSIRDLTRLEHLSPAREFPSDNAAGEGFTNAGAAMVMSPSLFSKYLDASKSIAEHAVLLPTGVSFSESTSSNDWATERLTRIRGLYSRYANNSGAEKFNLQGVQFESNQGGRLPLQPYLQALLDHEERISKGDHSIHATASELQLSQRYLTILANAVGLVETSTSNSSNPSEMQIDPSNPLIHELRGRWADAKSKRSIEDVALWITQWQKLLWKFNPVGHIGKLNGPKSWQESVAPIKNQATLRIPLNATMESLRIQLFHAADGSDQDVVTLVAPRFVRAGDTDIPLHEAVAFAETWSSISSQLSESVVPSLQVAAKLATPISNAEASALAKEAGVSDAALAYWLSQVGLLKLDPSDSNEAKTNKGRTPVAEVLFTNFARNMAGHAFIQGWAADDALSVVTNASEEQVRIPGVMAPKSVAVHPAPARTVGIGLLIDSAGPTTISALIQHVHSECGNGTAWSLELVRSGVRIGLAQGQTAGAQIIQVGPFENVDVHAGDEVQLHIAPKDNNHSCDLTRVDFTLQQGDRRWNMAESLHSKIGESNPLPDRGGSWRFFHKPTSQWQDSLIPAGSLLSRWCMAKEVSDKATLADQLRVLIAESEKLSQASNENKQLVRSLSSLSTVVKYFGAAASKKETHLQSGAGELPLRGGDIAAELQDWIDIPVPVALREGWEFVTELKIADHAHKGSVQAKLVPRTRGSDLPSTSDSSANVLLQSDVLLASNSGQRDRYTKWFHEFGELFPAALCYAQIVPVDEVVTLTLYHREDGYLKKLFLSDRERIELDQLWEELHYVSQDALRSVDAYEQLWQYATQDADPSAFEPLRQPLLDRAEKFRETVQQSEPLHLRWLVGFAQRAYRRPLATHEETSLVGLYEKLRSQGLSHDASVKGCVARLLVAPEFMYRLETPGAAGNRLLNDYEIATRLSYFLWSSLPDTELMAAASQGELHTPEQIANAAKRMLADPKSERFATAFFGQWLQISQVAELDEKSESTFPDFLSLRESMQQESDQLFTWLVQKNRPPQELLTADYTFLDDKLKKHYGVATSVQNGVEERRSVSMQARIPFERMDQIASLQRGGILRHASVLSKLSGASRTSAILRGTWISEVLLGEHLPKPPKNVPPLPESVPDNLSERQLIALHASAPECSKCHRRIDPFGFALEQFDAIGRYRNTDASGHAIDPVATLPDGTLVSNHEELVRYLCKKRMPEYLKQFHRKLLGYALGREVMLSDKSFVETLASRAEKEPDYGVWNAVEAVVTSRQFREIRSLEADE